VSGFKHPLWWEGEPIGPMTSDGVKYFSDTAPILGSLSVHQHGWVGV
jgi:hypothetical protein